MILPGENTLDDLMRDIDLGILLRGGQWGYVQSEKGQYTCHAGEGVMIRNGELAEQVRDVSISGMTLDTLANALGVSRDFELEMPGNCGKNGQSMPVNGGGPYIKVKEVVVGGQASSAPGTSGLLKLAEIACEAAINAGAEFADAAAEHGESRSVSVEKNAIKSSDARRRGGISVRAFFSGGTGWSSASGLTEETARQAGTQAAELARAAEPDPDFVDLVEPADYPTVGGLYDPRLAEIAGPQIAAWITENIDAARGVADDALVSGGASVGWGRWALANSRGVRVSQRVRAGRCPSRSWCGGATMWGRSTTGTRGGRCRTSPPRTWERRLPRKR